MRFLILTLLGVSFGFTAEAHSDEIGRWQRQAANISIVRDNWGIAHVYGKSDADAVLVPSTRKPRTISAGSSAIISMLSAGWRKPKASRQSTLICASDCLSSLRV